MSLAGRSSSTLIRMDWYPADFLTDPRVAVMNLAQEGAYRRLLDYEWLSGPLSTDLTDLAALCRMSREEFEKTIWPRLDCCFVVENGKYVNPRLERERQLAIDIRHLAAEKGRKGGLAKASKTNPARATIRLQQNAGRLPDVSYDSAVAESYPASASASAISNTSAASLADLSGSDKPQTRTEGQPVEGPRMAQESIRRVRTGGLTQSTTQDLIDHWRALEASDGIEPHGSYARHACVFKTAWEACGRDLDRTKRALDAFMADRSDFTLKQGHSIGEFQRTLPKWVRIASGKDRSEPRRPHIPDADDVIPKDELTPERRAELREQTRQHLARLASSKAAP